MKTFVLNQLVHLILGVSSALVMSSAAPAVLFDVAVDFSATVNGGDGNPWSYRDNDTGNQLVNHQFCGPCAEDIGNTNLVWQTDVIPLIGKVDTAGWGFPGSSPQAPSDASDGDMISHGPALLRLTIPNTVAPDSQATITGDFWRPRSSAVQDVRLSVVHSGVGGTIVNDISLDGTNSVSPHSFSQDVMVNPGETIDVQMIRNNFYAFQFTVNALNVDPGTPSEWRTDGSGNWNVDTNWTNGTPTTNEDEAVFGTIPTNETLVFTNEDVTVRSITFAHTMRYVVAGTRSVSLEKGSLDAARLDVALGNHEFQAPVSLLSATESLIVSGGSLTFNNTLDLGGKGLTKTGLGEMRIRNDFVTGGGLFDIQQGNVTGNGTIGGDVVNGGGTISPGNSLAATSVPEPNTIVLLAMGILLYATLLRPAIGS